ncbi:MAG: class IV adenylate cyclase [Sulfolobaceae archaeon]
MIESEIKIKINSPELSILEEEFKKNFKYLGEEIQEDIYYNSIYRDFKVTDEALRLRIINDSIIELTYKGPKISSRSKVREEITCRISDYKAIDKILEKIGFYKVIRIKKIRKNFKKENFLISLDYVEGLGSFLEVEGISVSEDELLNFTENLLKRFNIKGQKTLKSYLELLLESR